MDCCGGIFCGEGGSAGFPFRCHSHVCSKGIESDESNLADPLEGTVEQFPEVGGWRDFEWSYKKGREVRSKGRNQCSRELFSL